MKELVYEKTDLSRKLIKLEVTSIPPPIWIYYSRSNDPPTPLNPKNRKKATNQVRSVKMKTRKKGLEELRKWLKDILYVQMSNARNPMGFIFIIYMQI